MTRHTVARLFLGIVTFGFCGCAHRGLYQIQQGSLVSLPDWKLNAAELETVRETITRDVSRRGFFHGIPILWHMRVVPTETDRNKFIYVVPLFSFHFSNWTVGNLANIRITHAPISHGVVQDWPWSWDTNLLLLWQSQYAYYGVANDQEIVLYRDYVGSLFFLPLTRLFLGAQEVARIRRAAAE